MSRVNLGLCFVLLVTATAAKSEPAITQGEGRVDGNHNPSSITKSSPPKNLNDDRPFFVTKSKEVRAMQGETVVLPCQANNTGRYLQAWKKDIAILTAGKVKVSPDERLSLVGDYYDLEIKHVTRSDEGSYVCQMATLTPVEITHSLVVLVPAEIEMITSGGLVEVKKGLSVVLECKTKGNPLPTIIWTRKNNLVVAGQKSVNGSKLVIEDTNRHHAGVYMCTADNGVGAPVTREITVNILYAPEIEVERAWVHTGLGQEAQLSCVVHAHPPAEVKWFKSTLRLESTERRLMESRGSRHSLIIRNVHTEDLANYTCQADNPMGRSRQHVLLSGKPVVGVFKSANVGLYPYSYNISWSVNSYTPIEEYKLFYRKRPNTQSSTVPPQVHPYASSPHRRDDGSYSYGYMRGWTEMILPSVKLEQLTQEMSHLIRNLEPGTDYEARVQARNRFGWNTISPSFNFTTSNLDGKHSHNISRELTPESAILPEAEMRDLGVKAYGRSSSLKSSLVSLLVPTVLFLWPRRTSFAWT